MAFHSQSPAVVYLLWPTYYGHALTLACTYYGLCLPWQSPAVVYECASALVALSSSQTAIKAAATSYTQLLSSQSDNNIKLIVLERLQDLRKQHPKVLQGMIMDIIRGLSSANLDIRKKTLDITLSLVVPNNIGEVMQVLKKEVQKTQGEDGEKNAEYRGMLISTIHSAAVKFPDTASTVVPVLMDFMGDANQVRRHSPPRSHRHRRCPYPRFRPRPRAHPRAHPHPTPSPSPAPPPQPSPSSP